MGNIPDVVYIVGMFIIAIAAMLFIPAWRMKRATPKVLKAFRDHNAVSNKNAITLEELGIKMPGWTDGLFSRRDYKRYALRALISTGIVQTTEEGKVYLSEENLSASKLIDSQKRLGL